MFDVFFISIYIIGFFTTVCIFVKTKEYEGIFAPLMILATFIWPVIWIVEFFIVFMVNPVLNGIEKICKYFKNIKREINKNGD